MPVREYGQAPFILRKAIQDRQDASWAHLRITGGVLRILKEKNLQMHENTIVRRGNVQFTAQILEET